MRLTKRFALPLLLLVFTGAAQAAPATQEEAQRLTKLAETYLGTPKPGEPPSVTVVPDGESYKATIDVARLANGILAPFDAKLVTSEPYVYELTSLPDGTWHVTQNGSPQIGFSSAKGFTYSIQLKDTTLDGIFDPKIMSFSKSVITQAGSRTSIDDGKMVQHTDTTAIGRDTFASQGASAAAVDTTAHLTSRNAHYTFEQAPSATQAPSTVPAVSGGATADSVVSDIAINAQKVGPMYDLWAFLVAHPAKAALIADQAALKRDLVAVLPLAERFSAGVHAEGINATVSGKGFGVGSFLEKVSFDDPEPFAFALKLDGLKLPAGVAPEWTTGLVPTALDLNLSVSPLNVSGALRQIIDHMDLAQEPPVDPDTLASALTTLQGGGQVSVKLAPSSLSNAVVAVTAEGAMIASPTSPSGRLLIKAKGLEREIAMLRPQAEGDPGAAQAVQTLTGLVGLARPAPDGSLTWDLTADGSGAVLLNGAPLTPPRAPRPAAPPE